MDTKKIRRLLAALCILLLAALTNGALAESLPGTELTILIDGQAAEQTVLNLSQGNTLQFSATEPVTWKSSKTYRGTIDENGLFTSITSGTLNVTATAQDGRRAVCEVKMTRLVTDIVITGADEVAAGKYITLKASVLPSNAANRDVVWSSSDPSAATVNSSGRVTGKRVEENRTVVITAKAKDGSGVSAQHVVTVKPAAKSISILYEDNAVKELYLDVSGNSVAQLSAAVLPGDASQNVTWKSSSSCVSVDQDGVIIGKKTGTATITATSADGSKVKGSVKVRVVRRVTGIDITGSDSVLGGKSITLKASVTPSNATEKDVEWSSSDTSVLTVSSSGKVTALKGEGVRSAVITARAVDGSGIIAQHTVTVTPPIGSMDITVDGQPVTAVVVDLSNPVVKLDVQILPAEAGQAVKWTSDSSSRVKFDQQGTVTALKTGTVTMTAAAQDGSGKKASVRLKIIRAVQSIEITGNTEIGGGKKGELNAKVLPSNATDDDVTWESAEPELLTVNKYGDITAAKVNSVQQVTVYAKAKDGSGVIGSTVVTITPLAEDVVIYADGQEIKKAIIDISADPTLQLNGSILPADARQDVKWASSNTKRASVDENGLVTAYRTGSVVLTASARDGSGKKETIELEIIRAVQSITLSGDTEITGGEEGRIRASVLPSNATNDEVTWISSDPEILSVNKYGYIEAAKVDSVRQATITAAAKDGSGVTAGIEITITPAAQDIIIYADGQEAQEAVIDLNTVATLQLTASVLPADARQNVKWTSSNTKTAKADENGLLTAYRTGTVTMTAAAQDGSGRKETIKIKVIRAVESIALSGDTEITGGREGKLKVKVLPSNATNDEVTWASSDPEILSVNKYGSIKAARVSSTQQVTVTASAKDGSGVVGSITVTVTPRASKVNVLRDGQTVKNVGIDLAGIRTLQLSAMVEPADALQDVKWTSSSSRVKVDANGMLTGLREGSATITASAKDGSGVKAQITVTVGYMVKQIAIVGATQITGGKKIDLDTRVQPSNATKKSVVWSSSDETAARVDSDGEVTAAKVEMPTQVIITATAKDGAGAAAEHMLTIMPAASSIAIERLDGGMADTLILHKNGASAQLAAAVYPAAAGQKVTWSSSDTDVVTVTQDGLVTARGAGRTTIVAKAADGTGVKAVLWVGVGDLNAYPYYIEVDIANQVVRVYERGEDYTYSKLIKRMICSSGHSSTPGLPDGLYSLNGSRMVWMSSVTNTYAIYATRIKGHFLFHSVPYPTRSMQNLDARAYEKLGSKASAGCIRLLAGDAKWIHDNVPKGCFIRIMDGVRDISEYGAVSKPPLKGRKWDPTNPHPDNPDFDPAYTSDVN